MTTIAVYCVQPMLIEGLRSALETLDDLAISEAFSSFPQLLDHVRTARPDLILVEHTPDIALDELSQLRDQGIDARAIIWVDAVSAEFASQAIAAGVRGILRRSLSIDLQIKCLRKVARGELWIEQFLSGQILHARQTTLTRRERQLLCILAEGLKNKEIAYRVGVTEGTIKTYLTHLCQKVGVTHRLELAMFGLEHFPSVPAGGLNPSEAASVNAG